RGEALSCVIIDKLPFSSPGDPVMRARIDALNQRGGNAFMDYQLPQAITQLKQGVGRLIRDETDRGVMVLCDPRLVTKQYGALFINSLPRMYRTRVPEKVRDFFSAQARDADTEAGAESGATTS
ncbi:MAG: helicase C-terminal domain-containing protein, partial [Pseudomonadota bacterium]